MRWFKPNLRSSIYAIFSSGSAAAPPTPETVIGIEDIRNTMLALAALDAGERGRIVARRIRFANDIEALWFIRGDLMALLANVRGEAVARDLLHDLSDMFTDLLPQGLRSRPSPLSG